MLCIHKIRNLVKKSKENSTERKEIEAKIEAAAKSGENNVFFVGDRLSPDVESGLLVAGFSLQYKQSCTGRKYVIIGWL